MPNFWSKAGQYITEKISGTRTQDEDFTKACEKMKITEKGLSSLKIVLQNYFTYSENFKKFFSDFNSAIQLIYKDSPFYDFTQEITVKHQIIQSEFEQMDKKMNILFLKTSEWSVIFESAKDQILKREEKRKVYDHYEVKLSKMNKSNQKKDAKYIERNEGKFSKAASEYVEVSEKAFNTINNSLKIAYELTNPIVDEVITSEKKLFQVISQSLSCFSNNTNTSNLLKTQQKRLSNPNVEAPIKKSSALLGRMSVIAGGNDESHAFYGAETYSNIYINSRMTNSFKEMTKEQLDEFYSFEDDFV